jgi:hypothetical protein
MSCTSSDKWMSAVVAGILFIALSSPMAYNLTSSLSESLGVGIQSARRGCPNMVGLGVHAVVYALVVRLLLAFRGQCYSTKDKWTVSLMAGLMFFILSSPYVYRLEESLVSSVGLPLDIADLRGCPETTGLITNGVAFALLSRLLVF